MRGRLAGTLWLLALWLATPAQGQKARPAPSPAPQTGAGSAKAAGRIVTCGALANLRILLTETGGDPGAVAARLADPKADHLGCARTDRDKVEGPAEHAVVGGTAYDCLKVRESSLCRWALSAAPAEAR
ncbi:hypothetical protein OPKNFCMD_4588 [Methylobacterium crusticola]|uniref:Uncharacterized protein n=1 Tax=Methylobacterium crusticola TaxID=1697972 RepID=A0ABQ4R4W3_9HYPH|nr:hypothetical protein [Methylobacterium crusticola]GJD51829.1 hypothetical protein OPKNFCMD_4588 [Methylobacterium crusticola]